MIRLVIEHNYGRKDQHSDCIQYKSSLLAIYPTHCLPSDFSDPPAPYISVRYLLPLQHSSNRRSIINHHHSLSKILCTSLQSCMCGAFGVIEVEILLACKLRLRDEIKTLTAGIFVCRAGFEGKDVWLAVLIFPRKISIAQGLIGDGSSWG
jgi:hypothetical protein